MATTTERKIVGGPDKMQLVFALFDEPSSRHPRDIEERRQKLYGGRRRIQFKTEQGWHGWFLKGAVLANWTPDGNDWILFVDMMPDETAPSRLRIVYSTKTHKGVCDYIDNFPS